VAQRSQDITYTLQSEESCKMLFSKQSRFAKTHRGYCDLVTTGMHTRPNL